VSGKSVCDGVRTWIGRGNDDVQSWRVLGSITMELEAKQFFLERGNLDMVELDGTANGGETCLHSNEDDMRKLD
jgi:hypothetical protein